MHQICIHVVCDYIDIGYDGKFILCINIINRISLAKFRNMPKYILPTYTCKQIGTGEWNSMSAPNDAPIFFFCIFLLLFFLLYSQAMSPAFGTKESGPCRPTEMHCSRQCDGMEMNHVSKCSLRPSPPMTVAGIATHALQPFCPCIRTSIVCAFEILCIYISLESVYDIRRRGLLHSKWRTRIEAQWRRAEQRKGQSKSACCRSM